MKIGIVLEETWSFFHEIYDDLSRYHQTELYKRKFFNIPLFNGRIARFLFNRDLNRFLTTHEVVFFEWASEMLAIVSHMPKICGIVTRLHRYEMYRWADEINWESVDKIILVSKAKEREFLKRFPDQASKTVVIPEAVSTERFHPAWKEFSGEIGTLCHLTPRKRVYELILAFSELVQHRDGLHLHIGGGKRPLFLEYYEALHNLVRQLGLQDQVTFYDNVEKPEDWYHQIDIFISNSYSEGLQVAPIEAMASGCFCLSHRWEGADELLPEENLYYSNTELNQKILRYCEASESQRQQLKAKMRAIVCDRFDIHQTRADIRQLIEEAGAPGKKGSKNMVGQ
jgi:glycosyltransferase involved in cell wall biosynthesis